MKRGIILGGLALCGWLSTGPAWAAGTLTPVGSPHAPIRIRDHHVNVVINNGFARTEVAQTFFNPNDRDLEGIYAFPVPRSASLAEMTIYIGETEIHGEVVPRDEAEQIYEEERKSGNDTGLGNKNGYQNFEFYVSPIRANDETRVRFVYYQPLEIDTGVGRYVYPLEEGGTDDLAAGFWTLNSAVEGNLSIDLELRSAWPVTDVRIPGFETAGRVTQLADGHYRVLVETQAAALTRDFVFYYRLQDGLPGRVELIPYRPDESEPGHFMLVLTPGIDLKPLTRGSDFVFVLDVSGSMSGKIQTLARGVSKAIGELRPEDRFRIVTFNNRAHELSRGWQAATPENVQDAIREVESLRAEGSTNLYEGLSLGLERLDDDRTTSVVLVTDAVTNTGVVDPRDFHALMTRYDVRVFGFLIGNSANWPLLRAICDASGGFYAGISNDDDLLGQILLAKSKITHEALHDVQLDVSGIKISDTTGQTFRKVYRGQQLALFGRFEEGGQAELRLKTKMSGQDRVYSTSFDFPDLAEDHPEIERLWAMSQIEEIEDQMSAGLIDSSEGSDAIRGLGVSYQLVTDETSMLVLPDEVFDRYGIERHNRERVALERAAQARRAQQPIVSRRVDGSRPMFKDRAPALGSGALDPLSGVLLLALAGVARALGSRRERG
jgi:Ca-activated chloride channel family protein